MNDIVTPRMFKARALAALEAQEEAARLREAANAASAKAKRLIEECAEYADFANANDEATVEQIFSVLECHEGDPILRGRYGECEYSLAYGYSITRLDEKADPNNAAYLRTLPRSFVRVKRELNKQAIAAMRLATDQLAAYDLRRVRRPSFKVGRAVPEAEDEA